MTTNHVVGGSNPSGRAFGVVESSIMMLGSVKIILLSVLLIGVLWFMRHMQNDGRQKFERLFQGEPSPKRIAKILIDSRLTWCSTRVKSIQYRQELKIEERNLEWIRVMPGESSINSAEVENWFGKHCTLVVKMKPYHSVEPEDLEPILRVSFVNGDSGTFFISGKQVYGWRGERFASPQLTRAIQQIVQLMTK